MRRLLLGAVLLILACEGAATLPAPSQPAQGRGAPTATIDVSDMMGGFPAATFLVVTDDGVKAFALLNHATKYTITTSGAPQVASGNGQIYIADEVSEGTRLRWIDQVTGGVRATWTEPGRRLVSTGIGHGALAVEPTSGRVLALYSTAGGRRVVEAYDAYTLRPAGVRLESDCGDRVLAAADRVVLPCFAAGRLVIKDAGAPRIIDPGIGTLVAAAMSTDGTTMVGRDDGTLARISPAEVTVEKIEPFRTARLVPDGIASPEPGRFAVALATSDRQIGVSETRSTQRYISFPATLEPRGGILARGQFAYWTSGRAAMHIDLQQGFYEQMALLPDSTLLPGGVGE